MISTNDSAQAFMKPERSVRHSDAVRHSLLAWARWQLDMPGEWQPLKLSGTPQKGQMVVGDSTCAIFIIKWERPKKGKVVDAKRWVAERLKRHGVLPQGNTPARKRFTACGWAQSVQSEEGKAMTYWYGYSESARLFLGITVNGALPEALRDRVVGEVLPSLRTTPEDAESVWAMYNLSFRVPVGFELAQRHLFSGDVALEFARGKRETLLLRQVYPGELALGRRSSEKWLEVYPFKEHRRLRRATLQVEPWRCTMRPGLAGMRRVAWKRLPAPLGWCAPRRTGALAVHDEALNRLLIAEHMINGAPDESLCESAIRKMNEELYAG
jgi:hypothetical protein